MIDDTITLLDTLTIPNIRFITVCVTDDLSAFAYTTCTVYETALHYDLECDVVDALAIIYSMA